MHERCPEIPEGWCNCQALRKDRQRALGRCDAVLSLGGHSANHKLLMKLNEWYRRMPVRKPWLGLLGANGFSEELLRATAASLYGPTSKAISSSTLSELMVRTSPDMVYYATRSLVRMGRGVDVARDLRDMLADFSKELSVPRISMEAVRLGWPWILLVLAVMAGFTCAWGATTPLLV